MGARSYVFWGARWRRACTLCALWPPSLPPLSLPPTILVFFTRPHLLQGGGKRGTKKLLQATEQNTPAADDTTRNRRQRRSDRGQLPSAATTAAADRANAPPHSWRARNAGRLLLLRALERALQADLGGRVRRADRGADGLLGHLGGEHGAGQHGDRGHHGSGGLGHVDLGRLGLLCLMGRG